MWVPRHYNASVELLREASYRSDVEGTWENLREVTADDDAAYEFWALGMDLIMTEMKRGTLVDEKWIIAKLEEIDGEILKSEKAYVAWDMRTAFLRAVIEFQSKDRRDRIIDLAADRLLAMRQHCDPKNINMWTHFGDFISWSEKISKLDMVEELRMDIFNNSLWCFQWRLFESSRDFSKLGAAGCLAVDAHRAVPQNFAAANFVRASVDAFQGDEAPEWANEFLSYAKSSN